jgi:hypothetical protein
MGRWFQRFVANGMYGEVSDATIQGYLRSASQLEDVWQQIDDSVDSLIIQGMAPWDAYAKMGYALAFVRACRTNVVFVQELLKADAAADPASAGYLAKVTFDQALALCEHIEPYLEEAIKASTNPRYVPTEYALPLKLGPRVQYPNQRFPLPHLQGIIGAAQQMRDWGAGLLAKYELALRAAKVPLPQPISIHLEEMKSELGLGDFHLRTGVDMVGQISKGQATDELSERAEGFLWEAMESFFKLSQLIALPEKPVQPPHSTSGGRTRQQQAPSGYISQRPDLAVPAQPSQDVSNLLNQVISDPGTSIRTPSQTSQDVSDLLNQVTADPEVVLREDPQSTSNVSDLLNQVTADREPNPKVPIQPSLDVSDLFSQVTADPRMAQDRAAQDLKKDVHTPGHPEPSSKPTPRDDTLEMLSEISGEQQTNNEP